MTGHTERGRASAESCWTDTKLSYDGARPEEDVALSQRHSGEWKDVSGIYIGDESLQTNPIMSPSGQDES